MRTPRPTVGTRPNQHRRSCTDGAQADRNSYASCESERGPATSEANTDHLTPSDPSSPSQAAVSSAVRRDGPRHAAGTAHNVRTGSAGRRHLHVAASMTSSSNAGDSEVAPPLSVDGAEFARSAAGSEEDRPCLSVSTSSSVAWRRAAPSHQPAARPHRPRYGGRRNGVETLPSHPCECTRPATRRARCLECILSCGRLLSMATGGPGRRRRRGELAGPTVCMQARVCEDTRRKANAIADALGITLSEYLERLVNREALDPQGRPTWADEIPAHTPADPLPGLDKVNAA